MSVDEDGLHSGMVGPDGCHTWCGAGSRRYVLLELRFANTEMVDLSDACCHGPRILYGHEHCRYEDSFGSVARVPNLPQRRSLDARLRMSWSSRALTGGARFLRLPRQVGRIGSN